MGNEFLLLIKKIDEITQTKANEAFTNKVSEKFRNLIKSILTGLLNHKIDRDENSDSDDESKGIY